MTVTDEVIKLARMISQDFNSAVLAGDDAGLKASYQAFRDLLVRTNGEKGNFGLYAPDGSGTVIEKAIEAVPGTVPHWGQNGLFIINTVHGRVMVEFSCAFKTLAGFKFHAVDLGQPFLSETGFHSCLTTEVFPLPVDQAAEAAYCALVDQLGMRFIDPEYRERMADDLPAFAHVTNPNTQGIATITEKNGQIGLLF
ncbi:hypothetical protein [Thalassospira sp.]|uniref:hypothetical protein n=1 Tax=Thalassospira sp. TaxID=1912094 RepID=UPI00273437BB|nr:hypothetical protein [Thalassospira sp.]MDP2699911.1 hypothetical protein [Thalassospira sp.]